MKYLFIYCIYGIPPYYLHLVAESKEDAEIFIKGTNMHLNIHEKYDLIEQYKLDRTDGHKIGYNSYTE